MAAWRRTWLSVTVELVEGARLPLLAAAGPRVRSGAHAHVRRSSRPRSTSRSAAGISRICGSSSSRGTSTSRPRIPSGEPAESDKVLRWQLAPQPARRRRRVRVPVRSRATRGCTSAGCGEVRIDPLEELGETPPEPTAYDGWGDPARPVPASLRGRRRRDADARRSAQPRPAAAASVVGAGRRAGARPREHGQPFSGVGCSGS